MENRRRAKGEVLLAALIATAAPFALSPPPALAQSAASDEDAVFRRGLARYDAGDYLGAITIWEPLVQTMGEGRGWKVLYNLGLAYQSSGDVTRAIERYEAFIQRVAAQQGTPSASLAARRDDAVERVRALKASHGALHVLAPSSGDVVMTRIEGGDPKVAGYTVYVAPGKHDVEIFTGTPRAKRVTVEVAAGATVEVGTDEAAPPASPSPSPSTSVTATPPPLTSAPAPTSANTPTTTTSSFPTAWVWAGAAVTAASVALPIWLGLTAHSKREDAQALSTSDPAYPQALDDYNSARRLYYISYAVPAVLAAATITIAIVGLASSHPSSSGKGSKGLQLSAGAFPGGAALCAHASF